MTIAVLFFAAVGAFVLWWLAQQRLMAKPWLEESPAGHFPSTGASPLPTAKIGMGVFLAVVGSLFALFGGAYSMRMQMIDWWAPPVPSIVWLNTGALVLASVALHLAQRNAKHSELAATRKTLLVAGGFTLVFLAGQLLAWRELTEGGYLLALNAANAFFYLITGLHALHVVGGLAGLAATLDRAWRTSDVGRLRLGVELCAMYWHFLLLVWLVVVALLTGWADEFATLCLQLLT